MKFERDWKEGKFYKLSPNNVKDFFEHTATAVEEDAEYALMQLEEAVKAYESIRLPMKNENGEAVLWGCSHVAKNAAEYWVYRCYAIDRFIINLPNDRPYYEEFCIKFHQLKRRVGL